ncbi:MAG: 50S ribosomal protein L29 [Candidatus Diapherotrites archaeon]|nr:50S ribosomal protein L29 [Candidatus Diapherotrites archaeon]
MAKKSARIEASELTVGDARQKIFEFKNELAKERAVVASGTKASNPGKIKNLRKNIARLFTKISLAEKAKPETAKKAKKEKIGKEKARGKSEVKE